MKSRASARDETGKSAEPSGSDARNAGVKPVRMSSYKPVGALQAGIAVLRHLSAASGSQPLSRIARDVKLNPSTCLNILRTLVQEGYALFDPETKHYSIGVGVLELMSGALGHAGDMRDVRAAMEMISNIENVTITLWRRIRRDRKMLVMETLPPGNMSIKMKPGWRLPLLAGASGRVMAAYTRLSEEELSEQYQQVRMEKRPPFREFMQQAMTVRQTGYAVDNENYTIGATSVAVPVLDGQGEAALVLSATMFSAYFSPERAEILAQELRRPANLLTASMPYL